MNYQSYYPYRKAMPLSKQINFQQVSTYILLVTQIRYKNKKNYSSKIFIVLSTGNCIKSLPYTY